MGLIDRVDPVDRKLICRACDMDVQPRFMKVGPHIRGDCPRCFRSIRFVRQLLGPAGPGTRNHGRPRFGSAT